MIVVDASALVDVVLGGAAAPDLLDQLSGQQLCAPSHLHAETLSALARLLRSGDLTEQGANAALDHACELPIELVLPTAAHLHRALDLRGRIRVLDGLYVALAEERHCPLLTTDQRLRRADPPCEVLASG